MYKLDLTHHEIDLLCAYFNNVVDYQTGDHELDTLALGIRLKLNKLHEVIVHD